MRHVIPSVAPSVRHLLRMAFVGIMTIPLASCTVNLNMDGVQSAVRDGISSQMGLAVASVGCPESREMKVDDAFECTVAVEGGGRVVVKVTQKDNAGNIRWELARAEGLLDLAKLEEQIKAGLKEQLNAEATVSCGGKFRAAEPGKTFDCKVTDDTGGENTVTVTMNDTEGNTTWRLGQ